MAQMLDSAALNRWCCDPEGTEDPLCIWLKTHGIKPYISPSSLGRAMHHYITSPEYAPDERDVFQKLVDLTRRELEKPDVTRKVHPAQFDGATSVLWGRIAALRAAEGHSFADLIVVATAIRWGHRLIVGSETSKMEELAGAIPPDMGSLDVISADNLA